jgi:hypothetical protein
LSCLRMPPAVLDLFGLLGTSSHCFSAFTPQICLESLQVMRPGAQQRPKFMSSPSPIATWLLTTWLQLSFLPSFLSSFCTEDQTQGLICAR